MNIKEARKRIDNIDKKILNLISKRFSFLPYVLKYKIDNKLSIQDKKREKKVLENKVKIAKVLKINPKFVRRLFENIMAEARTIQKLKFKNERKK